MTFDLKIVFSGLVTLVPNGNASSKAEWCALLLDGTHPRRALDGKSDLRYHQGFLRYPRGGTSQDYKICPLDKRRLFLKTTPERDTKVVIAGWDLPDSEIAPNLQNLESFLWAIDLNRVYDKFILDPSLLSPTPPAGAVLAQFFLDQGELGTESFTEYVMEFDSTLSGQLYRRLFAHEIKLTLKDLETASLITTNFDGSSRKTIDLTPPPEEKFIEISVLNVCTENPLQWSDAHPDPSPDLDHKWYYEQLGSAIQNILKVDLQQGFLPVPRPTFKPMQGGGGPGSTNCIPARTHQKVLFTAPGIDTPLKDTEVEAS